MGEYGALKLVERMSPSYLSVASLQLTTQPSSCCSAFHSCLRARRRPGLADLRDCQEGLGVASTHHRHQVWCNILRYEETVGDIKEKASKALGIPKENLQLFRHKKELTAAYDNKTLLELEIHTGFGLQGWDTREPPNYWPPVKQTPEGLVLQC
ncbi:hypothetical protein DUNSADRAFT_8885 [Dunaliella salina]|uniref:Ubiquitin-like domain-containing protein n=1 Tax=Dunaliella salina TaxID=3046 RepID=A0ABQ7GIP9_DUNSA|nr:hypothetical protein DUNSADRAFT_8885 [Dunaliella salina]|eukprot:KAF5834457.1 hypothetical protein DUNSADRAFT_8885 [Dunaliella salina]